MKENWSELTVDGRTRRALPLPVGVSFESVSTTHAHVIEPLFTNLGRNAKPHCCYVSTVIFYAENADGTTDYKNELDQCSYELHSGAWTQILIWIRGSWWVVTSTRIMFNDEIGWYARHLISRSHHDAIRYNGESHLYGRFNEKPKLTQSWIRWTRPIRDVMRMVGLLPGKPAKGQEVQWELANQ